MSYNWAADGLRLFGTCNDIVMSAEAAAAAASPPLEAAAAAATLSFGNTPSCTEQRVARARRYIVVLYELESRETKYTEYYSSPGN